MKFNRLAILTLAGAHWATASKAVAQATTNDTNVDIQTLQQEIQDLDQKVRILEHKRELDEEDAAEKSKETPKISLGADGFTFSSANTNFSLGIHGTIQLDSRTFFADHNLNNSGFFLRRARPIITGTLFHNFDFNLTPEFGGTSPTIYDAFLNYRYNQALQLEAGKFKSPVGLEVLQSDNWLSFNERSLATDLMPNRDLGVELHGDLFGGAASYAAALLDGAPDYSTPTVNQDSDNDKAFAGRVFFQPWKTSSLGPLQGLGFGVGGSDESDRNGANGLTPGFTTDGQQKFFVYASGVVANGQHWRVSPQGYYYYGPFGFLGEYVISDQDVSRTTAPLGSADLRNTAWEVSAGWVLTGEKDSYNGVTPRHPFNPGKGQWGAWQIVGRYAVLNVDDKAFSASLPFALSTASARAAQAWSAGINWYLNRDIRIDASFSHTEFTGYTGAIPAVPAQAENVLFTRVQLAF